MREELLKLQDIKYKEFHSKIVSTNYEIIGVRMQNIESVAKNYYSANANFFENLDFVYYEEIIVYGIVLAKSKMDFSKKLEYLDSLVNKFDNWAHVDTVISRFKEIKKYPKETLDFIEKYKDSDKEFVKRTYIITLMDYFLTDNYIFDTLERFTKIKTGQYYVDMALAWALSVALIKYYDKTLPLIETGIFTKSVTNKTISKARDSFRITKDQKEYLNTLKSKD